MGCDIHTMAEYETDKYVDGKFVPSGKWKAIKDPVFPYPYFRESEPESRFNTPHTHQPLVGRNYVLFALLADVRNTRALSNMFDSSMEYEERDAIEPLAAPRGVPEDASKAWKKYVKRWGADLHSTTYFTLQELIDFEAAGKFDQTILQRGYVSLDKYLAHKNEGKDIESWASYTSAPSMKEEEWLALSDEERQVHLDKMNERSSYPYGFGGINIRYQWTWEARDAFTRLLEAMEHLKANAPFEMNPEVIALNTYAERQAFEGPHRFHNYSRIRLVMGFDN